MWCTLLDRGCDGPSPWPPLTEIACSGKPGRRACWLGASSGQRNERHFARNSQKAKDQRRLTEGIVHVGAKEFAKAQNNEGRQVAMIIARSTSMKQAAAFAIAGRHSVVVDDMAAKSRTEVVLVDR